jgi:hypothetical protein
MQRRRTASPHGRVAAVQGPGCAAGDGGVSAATLHRALSAAADGGGGWRANAPGPAARVLHRGPKKRGFRSPENPRCERQVGAAFLERRLGPRYAGTTAATDFEFGQIEGSLGWGEGRGEGLIAWILLAMCTDARSSELVFAVRVDRKRRPVYRLRLNQLSEDPPGSR